ncbi:MAG: putative maltokinase [Alphaproteobacteria bacterium]|nr:putative maltokinase [Alphaproteobacteria bacterium]
MEISVNQNMLAEFLKNTSFKNALCSELKKFILNKRWYSAKDSALRQVNIELDTCATAKTVFVVIKAILQDGAKPMFIIPMRMASANSIKNLEENDIIMTMNNGDKDFIIFDASGQEDFAAEFLAVMKKDVKLKLQDGSVFTATATKRGKELIDAVEGKPQKKMGVEQSNTSVIVDKKIMFKMYRRVEYGKNPEIVTSEFLTEEAGFKNMPAFLGKVELELANGKILGLAVLQEFVPNKGDGWNYTLEYLKRVYAENLTEHSEYLKVAELLGKRTAQMHLSFAKGTDEIFKPTAVKNIELAEWKQGVIDQADKTIQVAKANVAGLSGEMKTYVEQLINGKSIIEKRVAELLPSDVVFNKTRFHGDYHLGQVVMTGDDFYLLDFEGEPLRPMNERQNKHSVLRDVAGMVRSFNYAAFGSLLMFVKENERADKLKLAKKWQKEAVEMFLKGYFDEMADCESLPKDKEVMKKLLDMFILEKALYEVIYEVANRPDWLSIPMNGLRELVKFD